MKKVILFALISFIWSITSYSQTVAIKNNLLYDATLTPNLGLEFGLAKKTTLDLHAGYNPFKFSNGKRFKHWLVQPEYRYWVCEKFNGSFWGAHLHGGQYSVGGIKLPFGMFPSLKDYRYEGFFVGAGVSYGYQWMLSKRWNLEATIGLGYAYLNYDKYPCKDCGPKIKSDHRHYFGPTKAAISIIYIID